ncbi:MAG: tetratricopeptide repeat protein [Methylocystis sp.]
MSRIIKIACWGVSPRANVIFVHGLGGHAYDTWRRKPDDNSFWPVWLATDVPGIRVFTLAYEAPPTNWLGASMPLQDRAVNILECLLSEPGLKTGPIVFVSHSLGGLIVKQIMLDLERQKEARPECADILQRVNRIVFAATPHTGSRHANLLDHLRFLAWPSTIARALVANDPTLRSINVAYRGLAQSRREVLLHRIFYETQDTNAGRIVDEAAADPGLPGDRPIPIDADHVSIVKPADRSALLYARTRDFIAAISASAEAGALELLPLIPVRSEQSPNLVPRLVRIAAIGLVALVGYKGVQALIAPPPLIDQPAIEKKIEEGRAATETHHKEELTAIDKLRIEIAREKGVPPQVLAPIFENLGMLNLTPDQMREKADEAIKAILARASQRIEKTGDGADIDKTIAASRAKLARLDTAAAQSILDKKIAEEDVERNKRLVALLEEKATVAKLSYDYPTAKAALERLLRINPDRVWNWIDLGDIWVTTGSSNEAMEAFRGAEGAARRVNDERYLAVAYSKIGDVQVARGDLKAALQSYADSRTIVERLAKADPGNAEWQRDLSVSYNRIGDVQKAQGDLKAALQSYADSRAIRERLAKADPGNAEWQYDLGVSNERVGDVQLAQGDLAASLTSYKIRHDIISRLAKADPGKRRLATRSVGVL